MCITKRLAVLFALLGLVLSACSATYTPPTPAGPRVVVAFYPYEFIAERLLGQAGSVENLTQPGAEPHDLELTPQQIVSLAGADLVIYQKGFQAAVDSAVAQSGARNVLDVTTLVTLKPTTGDQAPGTSAVDPHLWLDPVNLQTVTRAVADKLTTLAPARAADIAAHATAVVQELGTLDTDFRAGLANCRLRTFVTTHTAFAYLAARYHLQQMGIAGLDPTTEPSPARIKEIQDLVAKDGITTVFFETLTSDAVARSLAGDLHLSTDVLDPLEGLTPASRGKDYVQVMSSNLQALRKANGCQ